MRSTDTSKILHISIRVKGLVQGVGFRPNVWRLAGLSNITGTVLNDGEGVLIKAWGTKTNLDAFQVLLNKDIPPLARIDGFEVSCLEVSTPPKDFSIIESDKTKVTTSLIPDAATCEQCVGDINDQSNRRYRYPFTNCTHCGPRLSITHTIPYDRANTSMAPFKMCNECRAEYNDPADRRFHAQPNACPNCGPKVWLSDVSGETLDTKPHKDVIAHDIDVIAHAAMLLKQGHILAIKGIGGFHLACNAIDDEAVQKLRKRKKRYGKPLAIMADNLNTIAHFADLSSIAIDALSSKECPIVLLRKNEGAKNLAKDIAPGQSTLGFMLPYTPLHHLLLSDVGFPLVMTSGNISNEPQVIDNDNALEKLNTIADFWLMNDREIINRLDDSVVQLVNGEATSLRRARGYAPDVLTLPKGFENSSKILALGADLKNTFCLIKNGKAMVSQHIGDLSDANVHHDFRKALALYQQTNEFTPSRVCVDLHKSYSSTQWGETISADLDCPLDKIQHHHAHIGACLAEHGFEIDCTPVLGIALDGVGYGDDGTLWGGEFLIADYKTSKRIFTIAPVAIPGGEKASYEPWRNTFAHLHHAFGWDYIENNFEELVLVKFLKTKPLSQMTQMIEQGLNAPKISSTGRLFDAMAGALGVLPDHVQFEGQAAMALQSLAEEYQNEDCAYEFSLQECVNWKPMWEGVLKDLSLSIPKGQIAKRFHNTLSAVIVCVAKKITQENNINSVVLSGGVFQNKLLCEHTTKALKSIDLKVYSPVRFPANDGGISLGQAVICAARNAS